MNSRYLPGPGFSKPDIIAPEQPGQDHKFTLAL